MDLLNTGFLEGFALCSKETNESVIASTFKEVIVQYSGFKSVVPGPKNITWKLDRNANSQASFKTY